MTKIKDIYEAINELAPFDTQMDWDKSGFSVGNIDTEAKTVVMALDITDEVIDFAIEKKAQLIVTHHPLLFNPIKKLMSTDLVYRLVQNGIHTIGAHTNWDSAMLGVNYVLAKLLNLQNIEPLTVENEPAPLARIGDLPEEMAAEEFIAMAKKSLNAGNITYTKGKEKIKRVAVIGGGGGDFWKACADNGADALLTGDSGYHNYLGAHKEGIMLATAGHYETEYPAIVALRDILAEKFPDTEFITTQNDYILGYC